MPSNYDVLYVKQFTDNIDLVAQQSQVSLANIVRQEPAEAGNIVYFDYMDSFEMEDVVSVNQDTNWTSATYQRRGCGWQDAEVAKLLDRFDLRRMAEDPKNPLVLASAAAKNRKMDQKVYAAMRGQSYYTADSNGVLLPLAFPAANIIESNAVDGVNSTNASWALIELGAVRIRSQHVDTRLPENQLYLVLNESARSALKQDSRVYNMETNAGGNIITGSGNLPSLVDGAIPVWYEDLYIDSSSDAYGILFAKGGVGYTDKDHVYRLEEIQNKRYNPGLYMNFTLATIRKQDTHVVIIKFRQS